MPGYYDIDDILMEDEVILDAGFHLLFVHDACVYVLSICFGSACSLFQLFSK